ncbi:hypothetical protein [Streptacidiphilus albus]|uniref:hypothetical protein n=2 Tax=Streptacidiphilus albus TaxID=105425 RepID=UPI00128B0859|nr:hypothetical protein [Streptacidiphilus albus]
MAVVPLALLLVTGNGASGTSEGGFGPSQGASTQCSASSCSLDSWSRQSTPLQGPSAGAPARTGGPAAACVITPVPGGPVTGADGSKWVLYQRECGSGYPEGLLNGPALPEFAPAGQPSPKVPPVDPRAVALQAENQLSLPRPVVVMSPSTFQVVGVPTWLWLESSAWSPVSSTASVPGASVTATATPMSVTWDPGDGSALLTCTGAGTPWHRGLDPKAPSPDCGHTFARASDFVSGGVFTVTATAHWRVAWHGAGQAGAFPDLMSTAAVAVQVEEVQTVSDGPT